MSLAVIGGSGLYDFPGLGDISEHRVVTNWGAPSDIIIKGRLHGQDIMFLARHGRAHRIPPHQINYRANIDALRQLGALQIIGTAAVGGIGPATGSIVVPSQLIDYTYGREHSFSDGSQTTPQHIDFGEPYDTDMRAAIVAAAAASGLPVISEGVYGVTQGPRLETAAEIDRLERDGCTLVGMTGMPEAGLARELALPYANISLVVNPAAGRAEAPITMADIEAELARGMGAIVSIIDTLVKTSKD